MEEITLVKDFAIIMMVAGAITLLFRKINQPPILGYLVAGLLIGPYTFPNPPVDDIETIRLLADLGLVLLLFGLGLEFSWSKIRQMGFVVVIIGTIEILTMISLGYGLGKLLGWSGKDSLFLGAALHISSSAIIVKLFRDTEQLNRLSSKIVVGILVVEDFAAVIIITILSGVATTGTAEIGDIGSLILRLVVFVVASLVFGGLIVPRIIKFTHQFRSKEAMMLTGLGLCFAMALIGRSLGLSLAAGGFLMGALIGDTKYHEDISEVVTPIRDMFATLFFVTIGMLIDITEIGDFIGPTIVVAVVFIVGKITADTLATLISGNKLRTSLRVGMSMPIMGEFSLAIAKLGVDKGTITAPIYPVIALVTAITSFTGPYILRLGDWTAAFIERRSPRLVLAYISRLEEWPQAFRGLSDPNDAVSRRIKRSIKLIFMHLLIVIVLIGTGTYILHLVEDEEILSQLRTDIVGLIIAALLLTMCVPSFIIIWRSVRLLVDDGARHVLRKRRSARSWRYEALRIVIRDSILIVLIMFLVLWFIPFISNLLSIGSYAVVIPILLLSVILFILLGFTRQIHTKITQTFGQTILGDDKFVEHSISRLPDIDGKTMIRPFRRKKKPLKHEKEDVPDDPADSL